MSEAPLPPSAVFPIIETDAEVRTVTTIEDHGDWLIWHDPLPVDWRGADWHYARKAKGPHEDPELCHGSAESREMCLTIIDHIEDSETPEAEAKADKRANEWIDGYRNVPLIEQLHGAIMAAKSIMAAGGRGFADGLHHARIQAALSAYDAWKAER